MNEEHVVWKSLLQDLSLLCVQEAALGLVFPACREREKFVGVGTVGELEGRMEMREGKSGVLDGYVV